MRGQLLCLLFSFFFTIQSSSRDSVTLFIFLLDDCIICQSYTPKINELHQEFGSDVEFKGIFPNFSSKPEKIEAFKAKYGLELEVQTDYWKTLVKKFDVSVTPEVVLYNHKSDIVLYKGRIDDEFVALGKRRRVITANDLQNVLQKYSSGLPGPFKNTEAVGCFINQNDPFK